MLSGRLDHRPLDVEAGGMSSTVALHQMQRDAAGAAADVEDRLAPERQPFDHPVDLVWSARRQIALAPQRLEEADRGVVIFRLAICRFDHQTLSPVSRIAQVRMPAKRSVLTEKRNIIC